MKPNFLINVIILILLFFSNVSFSQYENSISGYDQNAPQSYEIPLKTPVQDQYLRALILYVTFRLDDDFEVGQNWNIWERGQKPYNPYLKEYRLIDNEEGNSGIPFTSRYSPYTYSDWFCQMSLGEFDFIGDEFHIELPLLSTEYATLGYNYASLNRYVLEYANNNIPDLDFSRYDKWTPSGENWNWGGDGVAEMIIIHYRVIPHNSDPLSPPNGLRGWFWDPGIGGLSGLGFSNTIVLDGVSINGGCGVTALGLLNRLTRTQLIVEHEVCHRGIFSHYNIGLMTAAHSESAYTMTSFEREMFMYQQSTNVQPSQTFQDFTLRDFVETGDALRFGIPPTVNETFYIENHQKKSVYDGLSRGSKTCYDINRGEQDPYCSMGKGLYIYHVTIPGTYSFDLETSDGNWDWDLERYANVPQLGGNIPLMKKTLWNPIYGRKKFHQQNLNSGYWSPQIIIDDACSEDPNGVSISQDYHGSGYDGFNKNYDDIFSPYSNPSTNSVLYPSSNSGVTVRIIDQNEAGDITVRVYFNDAEALADSPPSKPKGLKHDYDYSSGYWCVPKITWHHNMEPDMLRGDGTKRYQIWRATAPNMNGCPNFNWTYNMLYEGDFDASYPPEYIDYSVYEYDCALLDQVPPFGTKYPISYKIRAVDASLPTNKISVYSDSVFTTGITIDGGIPEEGGTDHLLNTNIPKEFSLNQNYPNPFNPVTNIKYDLPKDVFVKIKIYDLLGREIKTLVNEFKQAGSYIVSFNGSEFASGVYFYRIQAGKFVQVKRMALIK
jgi:hypothetical protein